MAFSAASPNTTQAAFADILCPGHITGAYYDFSQCWCSFKKSYLDCSILGLLKLTSLLRAFTTAQRSCVLVCLMSFG